MFESEARQHFVYMWLETPYLYREKRSSPRLYYGQFHYGYVATSEHLLTGRHSCFLASGVCSTAARKSPDVKTLH
jgi:hypothetical protein